jgi:hypothetical protein
LTHFGRLESNWSSTGETGSGKSTLLSKKLEELYSGHITTRCHASLTFDQLLLDGFDQLDEYYIEGKNTTADRRMSASIVANFSRIRASIDSERKLSDMQTQRRIIPPQLTPQRLGEFLGAQELCWVLEDFHKMPEDQKKPLAQAFKIFSDLSADFPYAKIIAIGATDTAHQVVQYDPEMGNRVSELQVPLMDDDELRQIIRNGQRLLNVDMSAVTKPIVRYSTGLASVCHQLALNVCLEADVLATVQPKIVFEEKDLDVALARYVSESSDTLKNSFDRALKRHKVRRYDNTRLILSALAIGPLDGMLHAEILARIRQIDRHYPPGNLTYYLGQLTTEERGGVLRRSPNGRHRFISPLHHTYAQATLNPEKAEPGEDRLSRITYFFVHGWRTSNDRILITDYDEVHRQNWASTMDYLEGRLHVVWPDQPSHVEEPPDAAHGPVRAE